MTSNTRARIKVLSSIERQLHRAAIADDARDATPRWRIARRCILEIRRKMAMANAQRLMADHDRRWPHVVGARSGM